MYYSLWTRTLIGRDAARELKNRERALLGGPPRWWDFYTIPDGWTAPGAELLQGVGDNSG